MRGAEAGAELPPPPLPLPLAPAPHHRLTHSPVGFLQHGVLGALEEGAGELLGLLVKSVDHRRLDPELGQREGGARGVGGRAGLDESLAAETMAGCDKDNNSRISLAEWEAGLKPEVRAAIEATASAEGNI